MLLDEELTVLVHRFGLVGNSIKTLDVIGKLFNPPKSRERVRQIEIKALTRISPKLGNGFELPGNIKTIILANLTHLERESIEGRY